MNQPPPSMARSRALPVGASAPAPVLRCTPPNATPRPIWPGLLPPVVEPEKPPVAEPEAPLERAFVITEYVEGSSTYKALEITALADSSLEGCRIAVYFNGGTTPSGSELEGALLRGQSYVLCSSALSEIISSCDGSAGLTFNGDDALALSCAGQVLDVIGEIGVDPGDSWGAGATLDHTLRRRCEVLSGRTAGTAPFAIDAEWLTLGADTFSDLGVRNCTP